MERPATSEETVQHDVSTRSLVRVVCVGGLAYLLIKVWAVVLILVVALILVGTLDPFVASLQARGFSRKIAVVTIFAALLASIGLFTVSVLPALASQLAHLVKVAPDVQTRLAGELLRHPLTRQLAEPVRRFEWMGILARYGDEAFAYSKWLAITFGIIGTTLAIAFYILGDPAQSQTLLFAVIPRSHHVQMATILSKLRVIVGGYMRGQVITSVSIGLFVLVLLWACGVSTPMPLAAFAGFADILPFFGGLLALMPAVLAALAKGPHVAGVVFLAIVAYQEFENRVLVPRVYGNVLRLPPAGVVLSLLIGGTLLGFVGALIALPVAAALVMLAAELRLDMPGVLVDNAIKERDERATRIYEERSAEAAPEEAAEIAAGVAGEEERSKASELEAGADDRSER